VVTAKLSGELGSVSYHDTKILLTQLELRTMD
jgi:hypothetical protein